MGTDIASNNTVVTGRQKCNSWFYYFAK